MAVTIVGNQITKIMINEFVERQKKLLAIEEAEEQALIQRLLTEISVSDLAILGFLIYNLRIHRIKRNRNEKWILNLQYKAPQLPAHLKIGVGDQVGLYDWNSLQGGVIGDRKCMASGVIEVLKENKIKLVLDTKRCALKEEDELDSAKHYCLAIQDNTVTYRRNMKVLQKLPQMVGKSELLTYLFPDGPRQSSTDQSALLVDAPTFSELNDIQQKAVLMCLNSERVALIHGPPGTGKTRTLCEYLVHAVRLKRFRVALNEQVLATAPSNVAVDNMIERTLALDPRIPVCRLGHPARVLESVKSHCLQALIRKTSSYGVYKEIKLELQKIERKLERTTSYGERKQLRLQLRDKQREKSQMEGQLAREVVDDSSIVFCTNIGAGDKLINRFDVVVIDECAQGLEVSCWIAMLNGNRLVVAGDHKQLAPTIKSQEAEKAGLGITLFERIISNQLTPDIIRLTTQYRMNEAIMGWSSKEVYDGQLIAHSSVKDHSIKDFGSDSPLILLFIDTAGCDMLEAEPSKPFIEFIGVTRTLKDLQKSKYNEGEAALVKHIVEELLTLNVPPTDIGVITPYSAQVQLLRQSIDVEVSTVDGFQGREKECIVISMVRSNRTKEIGFLADFRRMNVAVTRAKRFVCLIGNSDTVSKDPFLGRLLQYFIDNGETHSAKQYTMEYAMGSGDCQSDKPQKKEKHQKEKNQSKKPSKQPNQKKPQEQLHQTQPHADELLREKYERIISEFMKDSDDEFTFKDLNAYDRLLIHELATQYGLNHLSIGNSAIKDILISKKQVIAPPQVSQNVFNQLRQDDVDIKPKTKTKTKPKTKKQEPTSEPTEDVIPTIPKDPKQCQICPDRINLLNQPCKYCQRLFCTRHTLAEEHGCGEAARIDARTRFLQQQAPVKQEDLQLKLRQKINDSQQQRQKKSGKK